jgi:hypothetical protein
VTVLAAAANGRTSDPAVASAIAANTAALRDHAVSPLIHCADVKAWENKYLINGKMKIIKKNTYL